MRADVLQLCVPNLALVHGLSRFSFRTRTRRQTHNHRATEQRTEKLLSADRAFVYTIISAFTAEHLRHRAFSVAGPTVWNTLPHFILDLAISADYSTRLDYLNPRHFVRSILVHSAH